MSVRAESDHWGPGSSILAKPTLAALHAALEETPLIVEHCFYRGSRAPARFIFDDFERLEEYLRTKTSMGDAVWVWRFDVLCRDDNALAHGKVPDEAGLVPLGGAY